MATSYSNPGGTGDRRRYITVTTNSTGSGSSGGIEKLITGTMGASTADSFVFGHAQTVAGLFIRFQFTEAQVVDEAKWYQDIATPEGSWKWQGSNDASSWTDIGVAFTLGGVAGAQTQTQLAGNATRYLYYRLLGVSGTTDNACWVYEIEFKISPTARTNGCLYENALGTGNRTGTIATTASSGLISTSADVTKLVNGSFATSTAGSAFFNASVTTTGHWIKFDLGSTALIDEAAWYQDGPSTHGGWKWQGSPDNSAWTDIGVAFTLGGAGALAVNLHTELHANTTSYRYYRLLGVSGVTSNSPWLEEIEFRIGVGGPAGKLRIHPGMEGGMKPLLTGGMNA